MAIGRMTLNMPTINDAEHAQNPKKFNEAANCRIQKIRSTLEDDKMVEQSKAFEVLDAAEAESRNRVFHLKQEKDAAGSSMLFFSLMLSTIAFFVILFLADFSLCSTYTQVRSFASNIGVSFSRDSQIMEFVMWLQFGIPGVVCLLSIICMSIGASIKRTKLDKRIKDEEERVEKDKEAVSQALEKKIASMEEKAAREIDEILCSMEANQEVYESLRRQESVHFATSAVAQEIVDKLVQGFSAQIEACDRGSYVRVVEVPFSFAVYCDRVETPYGVYDFKTERVERLAGVDQCASLANAVAQAVQREITLRFEVDPSGGEVRPLEIAYEYEGDCAKAAMSYYATNADFVAVRSF